MEKKAVSEHPAALQTPHSRPKLWNKSATSRIDLHNRTAHSRAANRAVIERRISGKQEMRLDWKTGGFTNSYILFRIASPRERRKRAINLLQDFMLLLAQMAHVFSYHASHHH